MCLNKSRAVRTVHACMGYPRTVPDSARWRSVAGGLDIPTERNNWTCTPHLILRRTARWVTQRDCSRKLKWQLRSGRHCDFPRPSSSLVSRAAGGKLSWASPSPYLKFRAVALSNTSYRAARILRPFAATNPLPTSRPQPIAAYLHRRHLCATVLRLSKSQRISESPSLSLVYPDPYGAAKSGDGHCEAHYAHLTELLPRVAQPPTANHRWSLAWIRPPTMGRRQAI
jgi:hypothetical protein